MYIKHLLIFMMVLAVVPMASAVVLDTGTILYNSVSGYNFTIDTAIELDKLVINDSGSIQLFGIDNSTWQFTNTNTTGNSILEIYNQTNALVVNGSHVCTGSVGNTTLNDDNLNLTLIPAETCTVLNDYKFREGTTLLNQPVFITSASKTGLSEFKGAGTDAITGLGSFADFIPIIVIALAASVILGLILLGFARRVR